MQRLAKPIDALRLHYDVVVVGSGYGGGVAASRLARCGKTVCVLERGKEFLTGDFPDSLAKVKSELQIANGKMHAGSRTALFDLRLGADAAMLLGCGLGGGSLINANVAMQPDPRVFDDPVWPDEIRQDDALQEGYARAARMLKPRPFPEKSDVRKRRALENSAQKLGFQSVLPPLTVTFDARRNAANVEQPACIGCGDCVTGCNIGAKNTVALTYLVDAVNFGAEIFVETDVHFIRKEGDKWRITFDLPGHGREKFGASQLSIWADTVILAAGALGSSEILLRSRDRGLKLSDQLGKHLSGNGEVLGFSFNNDIAVHAVGFGTGRKPPAEPVGPSTTGAIELRKTLELEQGIVIHDGAFPSALASVLVKFFAPGPAHFTRASDLTFADELDAADRILKSQLLGPYTGAIAHTQMLRATGHDNAGGQLVLEGDRLVIKWPGAAQQAVFSHMESQIELAAAASGGRYTRGPMDHHLLAGKTFSTAPLGGCRIGRDRLSGVVNHKCQVFDGAADTDVTTVHEGLYVIDGAVVPRPLGVAPMMTIAALAERAMIHLALDHGLRFSDAPAQDAPLRDASGQKSDAVAGASAKVGVEFTKNVSGFVSTVEHRDYQKAAEAGKDARSPLTLKATILVDDVQSFISDKYRAARMFGSVTCPALSNAPMEISHGAFKVLQVAEAGKRTRHFDFRMTLSSKDSSEQYYLAGHKVVPATRGLDFWENVSQLYVDVFRGRKGQGGRLARGILTLKFPDFVTELRTLRGTGGRTTLARQQAEAFFADILGGPLAKTFGALSAPAVGPGRGRVWKRRALRLPYPETHAVTTEDHLLIRLTRYQGGDRGAVLMVHDLATSSQIFAIDTIETSLLEYLYGAGYDCWLLDMRASPDLPYAEGNWTFDDIARHDLPVAVDRVRAVTGQDRISLIAQGMGGVASLMALADGLAGVRSLIALQAGADIITNWFPQRLLAYLRLPRLYRVLGAMTADPRAVPIRGIHRFLDTVIGMTINPESGLSGPALLSSRYAALFGTLFNPDEVSFQTRAFGLPLVLGPVGLPALRHLARMRRQRRIVDASGGDSYLPRLANFSIPVCFIHGSKNQCFDVQGSKASFERFTAIHGRAGYEHHVIRDYGHLDGLIADQAVIDVFPIILKFLERTRRG